MFSVRTLLLFAVAALSMTVMTTVVMGHNQLEFSSCGPGFAFISIESKIESELNITANQFCSEFDEEDECKVDEYNACDWCHWHKKNSPGIDRSARCVTTEYHWEECLRVVAKPRKRVQHKFDWSKSSAGNTEFTSRGHMQYDMDNIERLQKQNKEMYAREKAEQEAAEEAERLALGEEL